MRRTYKEFKELELMTDLALEKEIEQAKIEYDNYLDYIKQYEEQLELEAKLNGTPKFAIAYPRMEKITQTLANLESYIRKAENILNEYEPSRHLTKILKNRLILGLGVRECHAEALEDETCTELDLKPKISLEKPKILKI